MKKPYIILTLILILFSNILSAQEDSLFLNIANADDIIKFENKNEIQVVSASRSVKKISDLPITIYVITREEILQNGYTTLVDVMKSLPGVRVSQPGSGELGEMFSMRGFLGNSYTKIMVNGITIKPSVTIGMPLEAQLPIRQAERIEIIFGPSSAVYGADAAAGVINIITKEAQRGVFAEADISLGEFGYSYVNFTAGGKAGKNEKILRYSFYGSKSNTDNLNIFKDSAVYNPMTYLEKKGYIFTAPDGTEYNPVNLTDEILDLYGMNKFDFLPSNYEGKLIQPQIRNIPSESQIVGLELKYKNFSVSYSNFSRKTHSSIGRNSFLYKYNNPQNYIGDVINRVTFNYEKKFLKIISTTNLSFLNYEQDNYSNFGITFVDYADKLYQYSASNDIFGEQLITYSFNNLEIVSGVSAQFSSDLPYTNYTLEPYDKNVFQIFMQQGNTENMVTDFGFYPIMFQNFATFMQGFYVYKKFSLMSGIRHDYNSMYNQKSINPRFAVLFKITEKASIRASYGTAFKAPAPNIAYNSLSYMTGTNYDSIYYAVVPNEKLAPEKFKAYEISFRKSFGKKYNLDLNFYQNDIYNLIINSYINADSLGYPLASNTISDPARTYINNPVAEKILYGAELYFTGKDVIESIKLGFEIGVSLSKANQILPTDISIENLKYIPLHSGKFKLYMQPTKRFYFSSLTYWSSKIETILEPSSIVNQTKIEGFLDIDLVTGFKLNKNITVYLKVINLLDEKYSGIDATGYDIDLNYNPQLGRNFRFGMTFDMN